jgi:FixJ family two-component response regulator
MDFFIKNYRRATCDRTGCKKKAKYVFLVGEADIPTCEEHYKDGKEDFPNNPVVDLYKKEI